MNRKLVPKIAIALSILQLTVEILFMDFDNFSSSLTVSKLIGISIPILIIISMWLYLKEIKKDENN